MSIIEKLAERGRDRNQRFLLIGGYAVNIHGYSRFTWDIDVLIRRADFPSWMELPYDLGYVLIQEGPAFGQFENRDAMLPPIDVIMVSEQTFARLNARSCSLSAGSGRIPFASVDDLIALKVHALKREPMRQLKHFVDVVEIARVNRIEVPTAEIPESLNDLNLTLMNMEAGAAELRAEFDEDGTRITRPSGAAGLEEESEFFSCRLPSSDLDFDLPVDPDFISEPPRLTFEQHARFCEEMRAYNRKHGIRSQPRLTPVSEEFAL